ncbi:MAG: DNA topoisomerase I [Nanoarchaeota archaeon]
MVILITSEKPQAALKIATALADDKIDKKQEDGVPYYELNHNGKKIIVAAAIGHLYNLAEKVKNGWTYPVFDIDWQPSYKVTKSAAFTKKYINTLTILSKKADEYFNACDVDLEGELIFKNILNQIYNKKDAKRMYFSTLTKDEIINAFENAKPHINFGLAEAGETRHYMDYFWGISSSRALTLAIKSAGRFAIMSTGRVQGPALKLIVDKELEIKSFKPVPYWQIELIGHIKNAILSAWHKQDKFWDKKEAENIFKKVKGKEAVIKDIRKNRFEQLPPTPFDLTTLQMEAYRLFKINPKQTLEIAQRLYLAGIISYPRTSSQQLPESLNYKKIISSLAKQKRYAGLCKELLKKELKPHNGKKSDPAHPAIHATGEIADLHEKEFKVYDLIVKRTLSTFSNRAVRETMEIDIDMNKEMFITRGSRTVEKGWHTFYEPYIKLEEVELPDVKKGDKVAVKDIKLYAKKTQPPKRYTPASIVKELEKRNLGTKSTRSEIIDTLYQRNYIKNESIEATELGVKTVETLQKYVPEIVDEKLTRHFEKEMDVIQENKKKKEQVLDEAKKILTKILDKFKKREKEIGKELVEATDITKREMNNIGKCPVCKVGDLRVIAMKGKKPFAACNKYPECKTTYSLPLGKIQAIKKVCQYCETPVVKVIRTGKRPFEMCLTYNCKSKEGWNKNNH